MHQLALILAPISVVIAAVTIGLLLACLESRGEGQRLHFYRPWYYLFEKDQPTRKRRRERVK